MTDSVRVLTDQALVSDGAPADRHPSGFDPSRALRALLMVAPSHQGGHSHTGFAIAEALRVPFPLTMPSLRAAAIDSGFMPYDLWPWLESMEKARLQPDPMGCPYVGTSKPCPLCTCARRDSDGNPEGEDGTASSRSDDSAGPQDIANTQPEQSA